MNEKTITSDVAALFEFAKDRCEPRLIKLEHADTDLCDVHAMIEADGSLVSIKAMLDEWRIRPERRKGTAVLGDLASFVAHANRFKDEHSAIFVGDDPKRPAFVSVINYHCSNEDETEGEPRFGDHRGSYTPVQSDEWKAWTSVSGQQMSQETFATFIEARIFDVLDIEDRPEMLGELPQFFAQKLAGSRAGCIERFFASPQRLLSVASDLTVRMTDVVGGTRKLDDGSTRVTYTSERDTGDVDVPVAFVIAIPMFRGGDAWQIPVRLRLAVKGDSDGKKVSWKLELYGIDRVFKAAMAEAIETISKGTELPVFVGSPEG